MSEAVLSAGQRRLSLAASICCTAVVGATMGLTWPLLALLLESRGVDSTLIGLSASSQTLAILLVSPFAPRLIGRFGAVPLLYACLVGAAACLLLLRSFVDVYAWFPIRFALGTAIVIIFIAGETWVNQVAREENRGRVIGVFGFLWALATAIGPLVIRLTGVESWTPFLTGIGLVLAAALPLSLAVNVAPAMGGGARAGALTHLWRMIVLAPAAMLATALLGALDSGEDAFLAVYGLRNGLSEATAVTMLPILMAGVVASQLPTGWLCDRMDRHRLLLAVTLLSLLASAALPFVIREPLLHAPVLFLLGIGGGGLWVVSLVLIGERFQGADLMAANTARGMLYGLGSVTSPAVAGWAIDAWPPHGFVAVLAAACLLYLPFLLNRAR